MQEPYVRQLLSTKDQEKYWHAVSDAQTVLHAAQSYVEPDWKSGSSPHGVPYNENRLLVAPAVWASVPGKPAALVRRGTAWLGGGINSV